MELITSTTNENNNICNIIANDSVIEDDQSPETDPNGGSANSSSDKMESLLVQEDEDDGLGTESLRLSGGSDDEDGNGEHISPVGRKKRPTQQILDSSDEEDSGKVNSNGILRNENTGEEQDNPANGAEPNKVHVAYKTSKFSALIDSDSEPEETAEDNINGHYSMSDNTNTDKKKNEKPTKKKKKTKKLEKTKQKDSPSVNSDSEDEEEAQNTREKNKKSDIIDSDSESSSASNKSEEEGQQNKKPAAKNQKKPQRASAKKAMEEMQSIQSETQRLYRETQVNIPYHKPKRHTLKEFLTRRTIPKPTLEGIGSEKSLKMSAEELEAYAKHLEERAKEATEFFKSESEDELNDITEDASNVSQTNEVAMETSITEPTESDPPQPLNTEEIDQILQEHEFISQPTTQELLGIELSPNTDPKQLSIPPDSIENDLPKEPEPMPSCSTANEVQKEIEPEPSSSTARPSSLAELKNRIIAEKKLPLAPTLKGDSNMIIDFETGDMFARKPTGVENLFQRFIKSNKNNKLKPEETTPSQELQTTLKAAIIQESNKEKEPKPGAAYIKLKENLRTLITRKRKEDFQKKIEETKEEEEEYNKCCGLDDDYEEDEEERTEKRPKNTQKDIVIDDEENEIELEEDVDEENEEDEDNNYLEQGENKDEKNEEETEAAEANNEEDIDEDEENENNEIESSSSEDEQNNEDPSTRKHRVIKAFEDSDDEANTGLNATSTSVLFVEEENKNPEEVENELLDLCSGQFAQTQIPPLISQIPITQTPGNVTENELEDLCSGVFEEKSTQMEETQVKENELKSTEANQKTVSRILSSDEEKEPDEEDNSGVKKVKKLTKKKKKHMKLGFSDDEDDEEDDEEEEIEDEEEVEEIPQTFIDYDSEENEIEVQMSKKDCLKQANAFLEKEAELSESEWGSADEDEHNLDKYDIELGDEDQFDEQKLHTELEQIHMRKVLDDDIREVKKIQDMLFDNEEADGVGRQRKFRWKNVESGFTLEDQAGGGADNDAQIDSADDEEEMQWRKMRFEREQLLMQKSKEEILAEVSATDLGRKLLDTMKPKLQNPNYTIENEVFVEKEYKAPSFLIKQNDLSMLRNSFLNHDKEALAKIAEQITKSGDFQSNENERVQQKASKTGNFVFAPLTEEEQALRKRKAEEAKNGNAHKKMKTCTKKSLFLDQLL